MAQPCGFKASGGTEFHHSLQMAKPCGLQQFIYPFGLVIKKLNLHFAASIPAPIFPNNNINFYFIVFIGI